ncbi:MAG: SIS domain-containing protein [Candidatus Pacebacteria bacterium]|nr:SIS domain-containing protein [Candidatus Paceibacterota bacterium]
MQKQLKQQLETIQKAFQDYNDDNVDVLIHQCFKILKNGGKIIATGLGKNVPICEKFIGTLNSVGIDSHFLHTNSAMHGDLGLVKKNDLIIILSKSGETKESTDLAKLLKIRGTNSWLLTCTDNSSIQKILKQSVVIPIEHEGDPWNVIPNNSTLVFLIFLQALAMELIEKMEVPLSVFKENHPGGAIGKLLKKSKI